MKIYLFLFFTFCVGNVHAESFKIEYKDTDKTYIQVLILDNTSHQLIGGKILYKFTDDTISILPFTDTIETIDFAPSKIVELKKGSINLRIYNYVSFESIVIKENKLNKITLILDEGQLVVAYKFFENKRVKYEAKVISLEDTSKKYHQKAYSPTKYKQGNYLVKINTCPEQEFEIEITNESLYEIRVSLPGKLILRASKEVQNINITYEENLIKCFDNIAWLNSLNKKIEMQPYPYKISWDINGIHKEDNFRVLSNKLTKFICD